MLRTSIYFIQIALLFEFLRAQTTILDREPDFYDLFIPKNSTELVTAARNVGNPFWMRYLKDYNVSCLYSDSMQLRNADVEANEPCQSDPWHHKACRHQLRF